MGKNLVLVGGGHAHMVALARLREFVERGHRVTVVGPSEYHYYSGMGPGMLGRYYSPDDIRFATRKVVEKQGGTFVLGRVVRIDADRKLLFLESGVSLDYDVVSFNAGSYVPAPPMKTERSDIYTVKPIEKLLAAQARLLELFAERPVEVAIIGGGPSSLEVAGNVWRLAKDFGRHRPNITIYAGSGFMGRFPQRIRELGESSLRRRGVEILEGAYVKEIKADSLLLDSGASRPADFVFVAMGVRPSPIFKESGLPTGPDGGMVVNRFLQSERYPEIFGGGDCISFKPRALDKVGVYAVRENPVLFHNLMAALSGGELVPFDPGGDYLLIFNLGDGTGILRKRWLTFGGRLAFWIKDYIDRRFMRTFQAIE